MPSTYVCTSVGYIGFKCMSRVEISDSIVDNKNSAHNMYFDFRGVGGWVNPAKYGRTRMR